MKKMLEEMCFGKYLFEVAITLRNSLFINGILTNLEVSYGLNDADIEKLEKCDEELLRYILECPSSTPKEMLYLELGATPLRYILMARRLMFHHYILNEDNESLVNRFFKLQSRKPVKNDWCLTVEQNLETLNITLSETEIKQLSINSYQRIVKTAIKKEALNYLNTLKKKHSKVLHIKHSKLEMQDYLMPSSFSAEVAKFAFQCRSRMLNVGANYKEGGRRNSPLALSVK